MSNFLTPEAIKRIERGFVIKKRLLEIMDLVCSEWESDPTSVQCFDLRLVKEARSLNDEYQKEHKDHF